MDSSFFSITEDQLAELTGNAVLLVSK